MIRKTFRLLFLALFLAMTACTSTTESSSQPSENHPSPTVSDPSKRIFFPRQVKTDGERAVMDALIPGKLVMVDNCIRINSDEAKTSYLLIWAPEFSLNIENHTINILNGVGKIVAHIGDMVQISGGEIWSISMLDKSVQEQVPPQCAAPYWMVGNEVTTINTSQ